MRVGSSLQRIAPAVCLLAGLAGLVAVLAVAPAGCSHDRPAQHERQPAEPKPDKFVQTVQARAPFDLNCPPEQVQIVKLGDSTIGATGCGQKVSYSCQCTYHVFFTCTAAICAQDAQNLAQPPMLRGEPPSSPPAPMPPT